jgi:hypothetical protein
MFGRPDEERDDIELPPREGVSVGAAMMMYGRGAAAGVAPSWDAACLVSGSGAEGAPSGCSAALLTGDLAEEMAVDAFALVTGWDNTLL